MLDVLWLPLAFIAIIVFAGLFVRLSRSATSRPTDLPYRKREYLLTRAERSFYEVLRRATPPEYVVFTKVRVADILFVERGTETRMAHQNRIDRKHVDFLLCSVTTISPVLVVELDDSSHQTVARADRDAFLDAACTAAGLPTLHVRAREAYDPRQLADMLHDALSRTSHTKLQGNI